MDAGALHPAELRFLLTGGVAMGELPIANPSPDWVTDKMWGEMYRAGELEGGALEGLCEHVTGAKWPTFQFRRSVTGCDSGPRCPQSRVQALLHVWLDITEAGLGGFDSWHTVPIQLIKC